MNPQIEKALSRLFERSRIVFWYDAKQELRDEFEALTLPCIEKVEIANNAYGLKYRLLREEPDRKFLLYHEGPQPADMDNWLLDIQLAHAEFRTDQTSIWLSEIDLDLDFADVVCAHAEFFRAAKRKDALKALITANDTPGQIRMKMLAVCAGSDPRMDAVMEGLLQELAENEPGKDESVQEKGEKIRLIQRCRLDGYLWEQLSRHYGYDAAEPSLRDFVIQLFKDCYFRNFSLPHGKNGHAEEGLSMSKALTGDALVFLKRWKDSRQFGDSFETLSGECADVLGIEQDLSKRDFRDLLDLDFFRLIDQKIISDLVKAVSSRTVGSDDVAQWIRQRRYGHWYQEYRHLYEAIFYAVQFIQALNQAELSMDSLSDGIDRYCRYWYLLDQQYRKFIYHVRSSGQASLMGALTDQIENLYVNSYLVKVNDLWQSCVDEADKWQAFPVTLQKNFFHRWVQPFLKKDNKICIIISDGMRYEIGDELIGLIRREDRYGADMEPMLSMLPSYTQLGMAALLPNKTLEFTDNESAGIQVNGESSQGTANRTRILERIKPLRATAIKAGELMSLNKEDCRTFVRDHDAIYVYHNRIDDMGKRETEERVFEAVEETLEELIRLIKKLTGANANNLLVTADHGFIFQNRPIDESDFSGVEPEGDQIFFRDRRFILGMGLKEKPGLRKFESKALDLSGDMEVQIPKSINRLRLKGSGSRYVHGGASLQEVVIPVIKINKKRQSDVSVVDVDILRGDSSVITSGQHAVVLYQTRAVTDKLQPRMLRAGLYTDAGDLISDRHDLTFDIASENPRDREQQVRFLLTRKADEANGREVILKLEERHAGTSHYKKYKSLRYLMRRSFTSDFDF